MSGTEHVPKMCFICSEKSGIACPNQEDSAYMFDYVFQMKNWSEREAQWPKFKEVRYCEKCFKVFNRIRKHGKEMEELQKNLKAGSEKFKANIRNTFEKRRSEEIQGGLQEMREYVVKSLDQEPNNPVPSAIPTMMDLGDDGEGLETPLIPTSENADSEERSKSTQDSVLLIPNESNPAQVIQSTSQNSSSISIKVEINDRQTLISDTNGSNSSSPNPNKQLHVVEYEDAQEENGGVDEACATDTKGTMPTVESKATLFSQMPCIIA